MHTRMWEGPVGIGWCEKNTRTRPPCWVQRGLHGVRTLCTVLSDLGGGVNGHDMNLRYKCGVRDDVTG